jgi:hypothetical protein
MTMINTDLIKTVYKVEEYLDEYNRKNKELSDACADPDCVDFPCGMTEADLECGIALLFDFYNKFWENIKDNTKM